ncbi:AraC family transcriptional regulator [Oceanobacillus alkalisoli]|uniref:AraC family transcriptional regulator n=1 Tax=Oceanobacillus alkalisoli TaxID=2925113 RepID=UPI001EE3F562|nr:AraC family transcriptional regulator [Oceanobacillus alkalisoli]MCG5102389.1 AraC family transcriptional regulator [Oceanobacillus alkalisoli]
MLNKTFKSPYQTYGFQFKGEQQESVAGIYSLGWEKKLKQSEYDWDGMKRKEIGKVIFQYTLNGRGQIDIAGKTYELNSGDAFLVNLPSEHRYYLPEDSEGWEFIFITLYGKEALKCYEIIKEAVGHIIHLDSSSRPVTHVFNVLEKAASSNLQDAYQSSEQSYSFIMKLTRHVLNSDNESWPKSVQKAILFIRQHYNKPISLEDIVKVTGMSKYHFTRLFQTSTQITPMKYVTKIRMEEAIKLLKNQNLTIDEIAYEVGYANGNYFNKVFRSFFGVSPGKYRNGETFLQFDHIVTD